MEILESGPGDDAPAGFLSGTLGRVLIGVLVAAAVLVLAVQTRGKARTAPPPSAPIDAFLVEAGTGHGFTAEHAAHDFVIQVDVQNFNHAPVQVRAVEPANDPAFAALAVAVLPGAEPGDATYESVTEWAHRSVPLGPDEVAQLTVAGRVDCTKRAAPRAGLDLLVDGERTTVSLPREEGLDWARYAAREACRGAG
ncbi:hypothetical protein [Actinoplanes sp. URMC 104]|uniref:hypothetical protein n=1 Tax=Actinoplanes sp. URMC 104 TaxID=3423409 RepID=UPI003F1C37FB